MGSKIETGCAYTGGTGTFAREIIEILGTEITYRNFLLSDGEPLNSRRKCARATFRKWADRTCTPEEMARFQRNVEPLYDRALSNLLNELDLPRKFLEVPSDADLLAEVRRRGL